MEGQHKEKQYFRKVILASMCSETAGLKVWGKGMQGGRLNQGGSRQCEWRGEPVLGKHFEEVTGLGDLIILSL